MAFIKPSHRGLLHKELGVAPGKKIPKSKVRADLAKAKRTGNVAEEKRDVFDLNFGKKGKGGGGSAKGGEVRHPQSHSEFENLGKPRGGY